MAEKCGVYSHACTFSKSVGFKAAEKMSRQKVCLGQPASLILIFTQTYMYVSCGPKCIAIIDMLLQMMMVMTAAVLLLDGVVYEPCQQCH